jgi:nitroreductase
VTLVEKPAESQHPIHDLLRRRWSPRAFAERPLEAETVRSLFEAARWAPSSNNEQPWRFLAAARDAGAEYDRLLTCLKESNRKWAFRAPLLVMSVAALNFEDDGKSNRHAFHDTGLAAENLVLQAVALGLVAHQMAGFDVEKARKDCLIPPGYEPVAMIAIGYQGDPGVLPEHLREREMKPRDRKPIGKFVFSSRWGVVSPLVR